VYQYFSHVGQDNKYIGNKLEDVVEKQTSRPNSQAFLATKAAPSITLGFDVFVQLVIAAITTSPCFIFAGVPWNENSATLPCDSLGTAKPCNIVAVSIAKGNWETNYRTISSINQLDLQIIVHFGCPKTSISNFDQVFRKKNIKICNIKLISQNSP
jgi:hypothetical protein